MEEPMTDYQFRSILKMVLDILKSSKDIEEATKRVEDILRNDDKQDDGQ